MCFEIKFFEAVIVRARNMTLEKNPQTGIWYVVAELLYADSKLDVLSINVENIESVSIVNCV